MTIFDLEHLKEIMPIYIGLAIISAIVIAICIIVIIITWPKS